LIEQLIGKSKFYEKELTELRAMILAKSLTLPKCEPFVDLK
jgi:hypothetical protein